MKITKTRDLQTAPKNGVSYDIVPSVSVINARADGSVYSDGIIVKAYRTDGSVRSENILPESEYPDDGDYYFVEYSKDGGTWTRCDRFYYPTGPEDDIEWVDKYGIGYAVVETTKEGIAFRLKHSSNDSVVLKEIPPIKVVKNGASDFSVVLTSPVMVVPVNAYQEVTDSEFSQTTQIKAYYGTDEVTSECQITQSHYDTDITVTIGSNGNITVKMMGGGTYYNNDNVVTFTVTHPKYGSRQTKLTLQLSVQGEKGNQGKRGRWYYYGGKFVQGQKYTGNDTQAPYVFFEWTENGQQKTGAYMLVGTTNLVNGTYVAPRSAAADGIWERMETDFKFLIAEVIFAAFAKFGSAVFSGDWMISQYGTINGTSSTEYQKFDESDPEGLTSGHFRPNYAVNLLTGKAYLGDAVLTGILKTKAIYTINGSLKTVSGKQTVDLTDNAGNAYVLPGNTTVYVPSPTAYEGLELTILFSAGSVFTCDTEFYMAYYTGTSTVQANGMSVKAFHSQEGLSVLTIKAIKAYGANSGVRWVVVGQRGILGVRGSGDTTDRYQLCPDGRLVI